MGAYEPDQMLITLNKFLQEIDKITTNLKSKDVLGTLQATYKGELKQIFQKPKTLVVEIENRLNEIKSIIDRF